MDFLYCKPSVFVIGDEYEILLNGKENGIFYVEIDNKIYYEESCGVLSSEKCMAKIRVPQVVLNQAKKYVVGYRKSVNRKSYYSLFAPMQTAEFAFKPLEKNTDIHIYHVADVHYRFERAIKTCSYFGDDVDMFIVNGDIGEVETETNYLEVCAFVGEISRGEIPVLFVRGNHDTRGRLAELYSKYFPVQEKKTFFQFSLGCLNGVVLDCGEDKLDCSLEYDSSESVPDNYRGVNRFHEYRKLETKFLQSVTLDKNKIPFAVAHVCPMMTTMKKDSQFDIERECYQQWNEELERMGIRFMVCGHYHKAFILSSDDERNIISHSYPVVVGSACPPDDFWGAAIYLNSDNMVVRFTNSKLEVVEEHHLQLQKGEEI